MLESKIRHIEDLIVAIMLSDSQIQKNRYNGYEISFNLDHTKKYILENYISRNKITDDICIRQVGYESYVLENNLLLERIIRDWTDGQTVVSINPGLLNSNVCLLLLCLFATKGKRNIIIKTNMNASAQTTLQYLCYELFKIHFIPNGKHFKIRLLNNLISKSISEGRPYYESTELILLLSELDRLTFLNSRREHEKERLSYAFY